MTSRNNFPLKEMRFGKESRMVFASAPNNQYVYKNLLPGGCRQVLFSYWYLQSKKDADVKKYLEETKKVADVLYIDSGIFTMYTKMKMPNTLGRQYDLPAETLEDVRSKSLAKMPELIAYTKKYIKFLNKFDKYIDWAFDMDIDIFTSVPAAEKLYSMLKKGMKSPSKIIRIWHFTRKFSDWKAWCDSGEYTYLAVEGGGSHGRDPDFYKRFVSYAHSKKIKVHILAITSIEFLARVNCDTADSSTWTIGGRYGAVFSPVGRISFSDTKNPIVSKSRNHWYTIGKNKQEKFKKWLLKYGIKFSVDDLLGKQQDIWCNRNLVNILYFRTYGNLPVKKKYHEVHRLGILDEI